MTNRKKLLQTNEYDLLMKFNNRIRQDDPFCIMELLTGNDVEDSCDYIACDKCIQDWLNEESTIPLYER